MLEFLNLKGVTVIASFCHHYFHSLAWQSCLVGAFQPGIPSRVRGLDRFSIGGKNFRVVLRRWPQNIVRIAV